MSEDKVANSLNQPFGSAMVVGGGIGGMRAALDLANGGYLVHLVTDSPSVGGKMAQLDKTFPTNECAMCLLGPTMTDTQSHPNIQVYTVSEVEGFSGEPGRFKATIRKKARLVDIDECTACSDCEQVCPVAVKNSFNEDVNTRKAVYKLFPQAVPNKYLIEKRGIAPCRNTCPAGCNAQGYIALVSQGKFKEALEVILRDMPFAHACGRVCHHPCETKCNRQEIDSPVAIAAIKRAAADYGWPDMPGKQTIAEEVALRNEKIAVVGAGPAGLAAAQDLVRKGFQVTVFDANPKPGGMLRYGIPRYRLPEDLIDVETGYILSLGIELKSNSVLGKDFTLDSLKKQGYSAVILAMGLSHSRMLDLPGSNLPGVSGGVDFLGRVAKGEKVSLGRKVVVIGGGNVAIDTARTALRSGAEEVHLVCLEQRDEMPAWSWEVDEAADEGIIIHNGWGPVEFKGQDGKLTGVELKKCLRVFDENRRFSPQFNDKQLIVLEADTVLLSIGQMAKLDFLKDSVEMIPAGVPKTDSLTLQTSIPWVFACGDMAHGPKSVVEAVGSAHQVVESVQRFIDGMDLSEGRSLDRPENISPPDNTVYSDLSRHSVEHADASQRRNDFREVYLPWDKETAMAEASRCMNCAVCCECFQCVQACKKKVIDHMSEDEILKLDVGAVVLTPGFELYDAAKKGEYGYGRYPNVVTSLEFERLLASTGPTKGHVVRPSDHKEPKRVAFIQCVGSRDCGHGAEYCSSICCMYSTKEAIIAKEHDKEIEPTIFYLDIRSYGKNFDKYVDSAKKNGVRFVRSMISTVKQIPGSKNLLITYINESGETIREEFDMVVLAMGVQPPNSAGKIAQVFGIDLNEYGFAQCEEFSPTETSRKGVYVAGAFQGPRDIPETVMNGSAAAATAGALLAESRNTMVTPKQYPNELDITNQKPRVGVFVCRCGINIAGVVDVSSVAEYAKTLPDVVHVEEFLYTCSQDTLKNIKEIAQEYSLNRVVVASCTIRTHQPLFREALREAGLNQFLFEMANIRDQCSWVHRDEPQEATEKSKDLVRMAVEKVKAHEPLQLFPVPVIPKAMVIGGGVAGMSAALMLSQQGFPCYLIEKEAELGGMVRDLRRSVEGLDLQKMLKTMISEVKENPSITLLTGTEVKDFGGHQGHFTAKVSVAKAGGANEMLELEFGALILATGGQEYQTSEYLHGQDDRVITNMKLEKLLNDGSQELNAKEVVFIQCVGSRDDERRYCSRTCCTQSIKNALQLKEHSPETQVYILYRDIRTYGFLEKYYKEAREKGIIFLPYDPESTGKPIVQKAANGALEVLVTDSAEKEELFFQPDYVVLATATVAPENIQELSSLLKLPVNEDKFFVENHAKLGPIDFPSSGIHLCGVGHSPKFISESIYQAQGAVARAVTVLSKPHLMVGGVIAEVDPKKCAACLTCVRTCPYGVPQIGQDRVAVIEAVQCHGCGTCCGECPGKAIQLAHYNDKQLLAKVSGLY